MPPQESIFIPNTSPQTPTPLSVGKFKASRMIVAESWAILKQDKEMMWFPVLSAVIGVAGIVLLGVLYFFSFLGGINGDSNVAGYASVFIYYAVMFFITNFFESGIYIIAHARFNGQDLSFSDGIRGAMENSGKILAWSLVSATVGTILQMIADRSKIVGKIVSAVFGAAWNILTYFSLPSLIIGKTTITNSFRESAATIRKTWGETIIINLGVGFFFALVFFLGLALSVGIVVLAPSMQVYIGVGVLFVIFSIVLVVVSSTLSSIFKLALYEYATTGRVPVGFTPELIQNGIQSSKSVVGAL